MNKIFAQGRPDLDQVIREDDNRRFGVIQAFYKFHKPCEMQTHKVPTMRGMSRSVALDFRFEITAHSATLPQAKPTSPEF